MFNNYCLEDNEVLEIIKKYTNLINRNSLVNGRFDEDLRQEIVINIYTSLTKNRKNNLDF